MELIERDSRFREDGDNICVTQLEIWMVGRDCIVEDAMIKKGVCLLSCRLFT